MTVPDTLKDKLQTVLTNLCASFVSTKARELGYADHDGKLVSYLLSIPVMTVLTMASGPIHSYSLATTFPLAVAAMAIPFLLVASLSISSSLTYRRMLLVSIGPIGFLLITLGFFNLLAVALLVLAVIANEAVGRKLDSKLLALSSILLVVVASVSIGVSGDLLQQLSNVWSFSPAIIGALIYVLLSKPANAYPKGAVQSSALEVAMLVASATAMPSFVVDRTGHVHRVSSNLYDTLGLDKSDVIGSEFLTRVHLGDKVTLLSVLDDIGCNGGSSQCKIRLTLGSRHERNSSWSEVKCTIIGTNEHIILIIDAPITERVQLTSLGVGNNGNAFGPSALAIVSHELRTPLNAIIGFSELMSKGMAGPVTNERQIEYLGLINQSGNHLLELVNSILDLSKLENGTFELEQDDFMPEEAAQFAISLLAHQASEKSIGLDYLPLSGLDTFSGDKRVCRQIILNLLSNAVKFTPENGHIRLRVETEDHRLLITVEDNGIGMSADQLAKAGTPFFQVSDHLTRMHEGAGLGLSLVRQMAKLHSGAMEIQSTKAKGTSVRVALGSLAAKPTVVTQIMHQAADESCRVIQINEESDYVPLRKTA